MPIPCKILATHEPNVIDRVITFARDRAAEHGISYSVYLRQRTADWSTAERGLFSQDDTYFALPYNTPDPPKDSRIIAVCGPYYPPYLVYEP